MLLAEVDPARVSLHVEEECKTFPAYPTLPPRKKLTDLLELLAKAKKPLIVAGGGVNRSCAGEALTRLAEKYNIPMCTTMTGQGTIDDDHRLAIGVIGDNGYHPHANWALEHADFTLFVGSRIGSVVTIGWTFPKVSLNHRLAQIDISPDIMANNYANLLSIQGDAKWCWRTSGPRRRYHTGEPRAMGGGTQRPSPRVLGACGGSAVRRTSADAAGTSGPGLQRGSRSVWKTGADLFRRGHADALHDPLSEDQRPGDAVRHPASFRRWGLPCRRRSARGEPIRPSGRSDCSATARSA